MYLSITVFLPGENTPLILAVIKNHTNVVKLLLEHGANVSFRNTRNETALTIADTDNNRLLVDILSHHAQIVGSQRTSAAEL